MGNTCVGPTSRVGFFDSVSAVVFRSRPPPCDQLPASSSSNPNPDSNLNPSTNGKDQAPHEAPRQVQIPELPSAEQTAKIADHYSPSAQHQHYSPKQDQDQKPGQKHTKTASVAGLATSSVLNRQTPKLKDLFSLGRKLGQGQFGTTYLCIEKSSGKEFACKSIAKRKLISQEDVEDVIREIQIMHHLAGNEHIIEIIGAFEDNVAVHLVMELCAGGELFDRIIERGHYSEKKAAELARVIVGVVEACHSLGVMHRDLKPENFLFVNRSEDSKLKTIDFGLSIFFKPGV